MKSKLAKSTWGKSQEMAAKRPRAMTSSELDMFVAPGAKRPTGPAPKRHKATPAALDTLVRKGKSG